MAILKLFVPSLFLNILFNFLKAKIPRFCNIFIFQPTLKQGKSSDRKKKCNRRPTYLPSNHFLI